MNKWTLILLLAALCALPGAAQVNRGGTNHEARTGHAPLMNAQAQQGGANHENQTPKAPSAEKKSPAKQHGQNSDPLNVQVERAVAQAATSSYNFPQTSGQPDEPEIPAIFTQEEGPLSTRELIEAEEELSLIRSKKDNHATFDKYPYLLDPAYRQAKSEVHKSRIRSHYGKDKPGQFTPSYSRGHTWADKVGL